ncbi:MAG: cupin domain-containing protein [Gammaproteobacteria bacterium]
MKPDIYKPDIQSEYYFEEGCHILEILNSDADPSVSVARARVAPGKTTHWHKLRDTTERYLIITGEGKVEIEGLEPTQVSPGDLVLIPPGTAQRITCTSPNELVFYAICSPRFTKDCYTDLESGK